MTGGLRIAALGMALAAAGLTPAPAQQPAEIEALAAIVERYCGNMRDAAAEARIARQTDELRALEAEIQARVDELERQREEYRHWVERRVELLDQASAQVTAIYAGMRPDAAALQLVQMDPQTAAAVLSRLDTRAASAIMAEMTPEVAGLLASVMAALDRPERRTQ